jgi:hypothetical protein
MRPIRMLLAAAALSILGGPAAAATAVYYNLFNLEGESSLSADFVTYATLADMLNDENRTGSFRADGNAPFGANIVGTGSDGTTYWNLFNLEGENSLSADFVTYATLADMLNDENRTGSFRADGNAPFGANIVGTGAFIEADTPHPVPLPATSWLVALGLFVAAAARARRPAAV